MKCARKECENQFEPKTHNMKYCSDECCRIATNQKLKEAYYEKKARLSGKKRICKTKGCGSYLSRYQETNICSLCVGKEKEKERQYLIEMVKRVSG
mgnify:CR=1 FL=1